MGQISFFFFFNAELTFPLWCLNEKKWANWSRQVCKNLSLYPGYVESCTSADSQAGILQLPLCPKRREKEKKKNLGFVNYYPLFSTELIKNNKAEGSLGAGTHSSPLAVVLFHDHFLTLFVWDGFDCFSGSLLSSQFSSKLNITLRQASIYLFYWVKYEDGTKM